jgi:hypothetical protein
VCVPLPDTTPLVAILPVAGEQNGDIVEVLRRLTSKYRANRQVLHSLAATAPVKGVIATSDLRCHQLLGIPRNDLERRVQHRQKAAIEVRKRRSNDKDDFRFCN